METAAQVRDATPLSSRPIASKTGGGSDWAGLRHHAANLGVAALFFLALYSRANHYYVSGESVEAIISAIANSPGDLIWIIGAGLMGVLSLVRVPPKAATINAHSITATTFMMVAPVLMKPDAHLHVSRILTECGIALEIIGTLISEGSRIYLGRHFGLLPANRGIVSTGPFAIVRHPIYLGWFVLSLGLVMIYPTLRNVLLLAVTLPFMVWRIDLEEQLLRQDPAYAAYCETTIHRIMPFVY